jgi:hypothetical protein
VPGGMDVVLHGQGPQPRRSPDPPSRLRAMATRLHGTNNLWGSRRVVMLLLRIVSRMWRRVKVAFRGGSGCIRRYEGCTKKDASVSQREKSMKSCGQWASPLRNPWPRPFYQGTATGGYDDGQGSWGVLVPSAPAFGRSRAGDLRDVHRWSEDQGQNQPGPLAATTTRVALFVHLQRDAESCNQDAASRWPALCIGLIPI